MERFPLWTSRFYELLRGVDVTHLQCGLTENTDYTITGWTLDGKSVTPPFTEAGSYMASVTMQGNYSGTTTGSYLIDARKIDNGYDNDYNIQSTAQDCDYTGQAIEPVVTVTNSVHSLKTLVSGTDYVIESHDPFINPGEYTVYLRGIGNYQGTRSQSFNIIGEKLDHLGISSDWGTTYRTSGKEYDLSGVSGVKAYTVESVDMATGTVTLTEQRYIVKNQPMIISSTATGRDTYLPVAERGATVTGSPDSRFAGSPAGVAVDTSEGTWYVLSGGRFVTATTGSVPAGRCYLLMPNVRSARQLSLSVGGTAIGDATEISDAMRDLQTAQWYDMSGRKLEGMPVRKGVYICNGRKVVIR